MAELVTPPTENDILTVLSVADFKSAKLVSNTSQDAFIKDCILDAWAYIDGPEGFCRRAVLPQTWRFYATEFPEGGWILPVRAVSHTIVSLKYFDGTNTEQTIDGANYYVRPHGDRIGADLYFGSSFTFPALYDRYDAVAVDFKAGWPDAASVPRVFRRALQLLAAHYYDNREETYSDPRVTSVSRKIEYGLESLLAPYVVPIDYSGRR